MKLKNKAETKIKEEQDLKVQHQLDNDFFREAILERDVHKCPVCGAECEEENEQEYFQIHHKEYGWECDEKKLLENIPDCKDCSISHKERFRRCIAKCELVCRACHNKTMHPPGKK